MFRFIIRFDDIFDIKTEILKFIKHGICTEEQLNFTLTIVSNVYVEKMKKIRYSLLQKNILKVCLCILNFFNEYKSFFFKDLFLFFGCIIVKAYIKPMFKFFAIFLNNK